MPVVSNTSPILNLAIIDRLSVAWFAQLANMEYNPASSAFHARPITICDSSCPAARTRPRCPRSRQRGDDRLPRCAGDRAGTRETLRC